MTKKLGLVVLLAALSGVGSVASANGNGNSGMTCKQEWFLFWSYEVCTPNGGSGGSGGATAAPEVDPASLMTGLTLALGGLAVLRGRRFKNTK